MIHETGHELSPEFMQDLVILIENHIFKMISNENVIIALLSMLLNFKNYP